MTTHYEGENQAGSEEAMRLEHDYAAHNYHPLPVVLSRAEGAYVWDPEGNKYMDFLSAYSAVSQGHCHPKIVKALTDQAQQLCLSSRAFYNDVFPKYAKYITEYFGYDMMLPMNTGAEAVETAIKLARKWGYMKKKIPENQAIVFTVANNFHGRTIAVISMSTDPDSRDGFGPYLPNVGPVCPKTGKVIPYNDIKALEEAFEDHSSNVAALLIEPIQGEAGIHIPDDGYLKACYDLCKKHNVLYIDDEIQAGLGRTGKMLAVDYEGVRPDILVLGKALSGGLYPVSAVLADRDIMLCIRPGEHGSTFGGNPIAAAVGMAALQVLKDENLTENARVMGEKLRASLRELDYPFIKEIRGRGLLNAIEVFEDKCGGQTAWDMCLLLKKNGLLAKPTHDTIVRLAPPLCLNEAQLQEAVTIIRKSVAEFAATIH